MGYMETDNLLQMLKRPFHDAQMVPTKLTIVADDSFASRAAALVADCCCLHRIHR